MMHTPCIRPYDKTHRLWAYITPVLLVCVMGLSGCGGGEDALTPQTQQPPIADSQVGKLVASQPLNIISADAIRAALDTGNSKLSQVQPRYAVATYRLSYLTHDKDGALVQASGLVAVPQKSASAPSPVVSYQHATTFYNQEAPSLNLAAGEPPLVLASLGYIVVAADYVGFNESNALAHPYLQSSPTARAVLDMLTAAHNWRLQNAIADNGQLYLAGYSEGGYATMAATREIERSSSTLRSQLRASLPAAGPYDLQVTLNDLLSRVRDQYPAIAWLLKPDNLEHLPSSVRAEVRRLLVRALIPDDATVNYDTRFIDRYLADQQQTLQQESSVHWGWTPSAPVYLFHGRDDATVPFAASLSAYNTLSATGGASVTLRECTQTQPSGHTQCVPEYFLYAVQVMAMTARDL